MKRVLAFLLVFFVSEIVVFAQEPYFPNKVMMPTPTAASLGRYGEIPVSLYTGTPQIDIPIYTVSSRDIKVQIQLQYVGSAIRVAQDASWVGLGWNLNCGGVVTRTIRGLDDFGYEGYYMADSLPPWNEENLHRYHDILTNYTWQNVPQDIKDELWYMESIRNRQVDSEPDVFNYNFNGYTGSFVIDKEVYSDSIFCKEINSLRIELLDMPYKAWLITTPDGFRHYFHTYEKAQSYYNLADITTYSGIMFPNFSPAYDESVTSWYLDSIVSPTNEVVRFYYDHSVSRSAIQISHVRSDRISGNSPQLIEKFNASRQLNFDVYLKRIVSQNNIIHFNRTAREDIEPDVSGTPAKLSSIEIYTKHANDSSFLRKFDLAYGYFQSIGPNNQWSGKRLKLISVKQTNHPSSSTAGLNLYTFEYNESTPLPDKYSRTIDRWGYAKATAGPVLPNTNNPTLLPPTSAIINGITFTFPGADLDGDQGGNFIKAGLLAKVVYPTKGYTVFDYELNDIRIWPWRTITEPTILTFASSFDVHPGSVEFTLAEEKDMDFSMTYQSITEYDTLGEYEPVGCLKRKSDNYIYEIFSKAYNLANYTLEPGTYILEAYGTPDYSIYINAISNYETRTIKTKKGGGVRIKHIKSYSSDGELALHKKYVYTLDGTEDGETSGGFPFAHIDSVLRHYVSEDGQTYGHYITRSSNNMLNFAFGNGGPLYTHSKVYEYNSGVENGYTVYYFHNSPLTLPTPQPLVPVAHSAINGKPSKTEYYSSSGTLLKKQEIFYDTLYSKIVKGLKILPIMYTANNANMADASAMYYDYNCDWVVQSEVVTTDYVNGYAIVSSTKKEYEDGRHKQVTKEILTNSAGDELVTERMFPHDNLSSAINQELVNRHIISSPEKIITYKGEVQLEEVRMLKDIFNGLILPSEVLTKRGNHDEVLKQKFHTYDTHGNPTSFSDASTVKTSVIWGYGKQFPVLKVINISVQELEDKVGEVLSDIGFSGGLNQLDSYLNALGTLNFQSEVNSWKDFVNRIKQKFTSPTVTIEAFLHSTEFGLVGQINHLHQFQRYEYDTYGRLTSIYDDQGRIMKRICYNLHGQVVNCN